MRARFFLRLAAFLVLVLIACAGCVPNMQYRGGAAAVERHPGPAGNNYNLAYIEFDEQGDFWDRDPIYAKEMRDMMVATLSFQSADRCYHVPDETQCLMKDEPRIISVTSETDRATGVAFPLGASLFGLGKLYREYEADQPSGGRVSQRLFFTHTPGHNDLLLDHAVVPLATPVPAAHQPGLLTKI